MKELNRDKAILEKMLKYCNQIDEAHEIYGTSIMKLSGRLQQKK